MIVRCFRKRCEDWPLAAVFGKMAAFAALLHGDAIGCRLIDLGVEISAPCPLRAWLSEAWSKCSRHAIQHVSVRARMVLLHDSAL